MKKPTTKSGFQEGRSKAGPTRSSVKAPKEKDKKSKAIAKLEKAKDDLADTLMDVGEMFDHAFDGAETDEQGEHISRFASDFQLIRQNIINSGVEFNAEAAHKAILKTQLAMFLELQPLAEVAFRKTQKEQAAYAAIAVAEQIKGLANELKMLGNVDNQSVFISQSIIQPIFMSLLQNVLSQFMSLKNTIDTELMNTKAASSSKVIKQSIDEILKSIGSYLDASRESMATNIGSYLSGDLSFTSSGSSDGGGTALGRKRRGGKR